MRLETKCFPLIGLLNKVIRFVRYFRGRRRGGLRGEIGHGVDGKGRRGGGGRGGTQQRRGKFRRRRVPEEVVVLRGQLVDTSASMELRDQAQPERQTVRAVMRSNPRFQICDRVQSNILSLLETGEYLRIKEFTSSNTKDNNGKTFNGQEKLVCKIASR